MMHKAKPKGKFKLQKGNRYLEECMNMGMGVGWKHISTFSLGYTNTLQKAQVFLNFL